MLAFEQGSENYTQFYKRTGKTAEEYRASATRPLPVSLFTLTHIKTAAIHARSDSYREADLVNHHSHTSMTEKTSYLTDANKEWLNQAGRITRLVIHDLQNVVYQPSITVISQAVYELELKTKVMEATKTKNIMTNPIRGNYIEEDKETTIIVSDSTDTALYFIHYINQASEMLPRLLLTRPDWVERTLIIQVEWMTRTLTRMKMSTSAQKSYVKLKKHLPPLFDHLLETNE
jgi:nucleoside diphosphate kinase